MNERIVSFCFDDGFLESTEKTARLFEERGLRATFCILAEPEMSKDPAHIGAAFGDWPLWRALRAKGHEIAPHGLAHERLADLPVDAAYQNLNQMFDRFVLELPGFVAAETIFHAPYLTLPAMHRDWLLGRTAGVRLALGRGGRNVLTDVAASRLVDCVTFGPEAVGSQSMEHLRKFSQADDQWQVLVLHGIDGEGWGSLGSNSLAALLDFALESGLSVRPIGEIFGRAVDTISR
jgi:hypothetical protein